MWDVNHTTVNVTAVRGRSTPFSIELTQPRAADLELAFKLRLPAGWTGSLDMLTLTVPAQGTARMSGRITPGANAQEAVGTLDVSEGTRRIPVELWLHVVEAPLLEAPAPASEEAPPALEEFDPVPPPQVEGAPTIAFTPAIVDAIPGSTVLVTLEIRNPTPRPLAGRALLAIAPLDADLLDPSFQVAPGSSAFVTFQIPVDADARIGTQFAGEGRIDAPDVAPAQLQLRIVAPPMSDGIEVAAAVASEDARMLVAGAAVAAGTASLGVAALWRRWPGLGLFALYARLAPKRALEHPRRVAMLDLIRTEPGLSLAQAQKRLGFSNGVARHHLALLESAGVVRSVQDGSLRRLWPMDAPRIEATPALRERALLALTQRGELRASELAEHLGVSRQALHYHVKKLEEEGRVVAQREGNELTLRVS